MEVENFLANEKEISSHYLSEKKQELVEVMLNELLPNPSRMVNLVHGIHHSIRENKNEDICKIDWLLDNIPDGLALLIIGFIVEFLMDELELLVKWLDLVRDVIVTFGRRRY